jgi:serine/threonine protein kinase/tetratricopeptide (TPR) repeat protein
MTRERWQRVKSLFERALEHPPSARDDFLEKSDENPSVVAEVRELIARDALAGSFLEDAGSLEFSTTPLLSSGDLVSGHFRIVGLLGRGGMGVVYRAEDLVLSRPVALKFLPGGLGGTPQALERLRREARAAAALNHPNVCVVYETGEHQGQPFIAMELLEGHTLKHSIGAKPLKTEELLDWAVQIANGLDAAHRNGIVHRDIKPANIFITKFGQVKILDFGLAKITAPVSCGAAKLTASPTEEYLTTPGMMIGTVPYMSPEQARGEVLDSRTDLFSFGAVLYEMATGQTAFAGATTALVHQAVLSLTPPPASSVNGRIPPELDRIIDKALEKDRELRYQHATDMGADLNRLKRDTESGRSPAASTAPVRRLPWIGAALILIAAAGAAYFFLHRAPPKLTKKDTIVLADFTNTTGDPVFDGTLRQGLSAQLEQSPFLNLLSDQSIAQTLALMSQPRDARLTPELGREVCQRTGSAANIEGSISSLGSQYVLGLKAVNCRNGDLLAQEQVTANGKERVLKALGNAATRLRGKLGESLASVQKYDAPPEKVTTPSLEALQAYSLGYQAQIAKSDYLAAIPFFQRAVSLDPKFAMAHARLGTVYANLGEGVRADESSLKAYELRGQTSEQEKFYISSHYEDQVTGNLDAARTVNQLWTQTYAGDQTPRTNLSWLYGALGEPEKSLLLAREAFELNPRNALAYVRLVSAYLYLNRLDEAKTAALEARGRQLDGLLIHHILYKVHFLQHNVVGMENEAAGLAGKPGYDDVMLAIESDTASYGGELAKARELTRLAVDSAQRADNKEAAAGHKAEAAVREAWMGNVVFAKQEARSALALSNGKGIEVHSALALMLSGDSAAAGRLAGDLGERFPEDTIVRFEWLPEIYAAMALHSGDSGKAMEALAAATHYESEPYDVRLGPAYLRGQAYLAAKQGEAAAREFQKILDHPGIVANNPIGALAHLGQGRAYVLSGDSAKAKTAYRHFLALWKNADQDIPVLRQAKAEYAKLQ